MRSLAAYGWLSGGFYTEYLTLGGRGVLHNVRGKDRFVAFPKANYHAGVFMNTGGGPSVDFKMP